MGVGPEQQEFAQFYADSWGPCLRAVAISVGSRQEAEGLVAEAFARAWASWQRVSRHPAPRAWVVRTALNAQVSWWRRQRRELPLGPRDSPAPTLESDAVDPALVASVRRLPPRQREVIILRLLLDLDTETTAKHLGVAPGTVTAHLSRAVAALRHELNVTSTTEVNGCTARTK